MSARSDQKPSKKDLNRRVLHQAIKEFNEAKNKPARSDRAAKASHLTTNYELTKQTQATSITPEEFDNHLKILQALADTSKHLTVETDIVSLLERIAESVVTSLGVKKANFWDFTEDKTGVFIMAAYGLQDQYISNSYQNPMPLGEGWVGRAMQTGQAWSTSDVQKDPLMPDTWIPAAKEQDYHGLLCMPLKHGNEIIGGMCIYHQDIHEWKYFEYEVMNIVANQAATALMNVRAFEKLDAERKKTSSVINSLQDGLIMYDNDHSIRLINPRALEILNLPANTSTTKKRLKSDKTLHNLLTITKLNQQDFTTTEIELYTSQAITLEVTRIPVLDEDQQRIGEMQILHDTTEKRQIELMKSNFVSVASHQMRTPLTGVRWAIDVLKSQDMGELNDPQLTLIDRMRSTAANFAQLIDDLLDVSRLDEGKIQYQFTRTNILPIVQKVFENLSAAAEAQSVRYTLTLPKKPLPMVVVDQTQIEVAIQNLIDNAIKYTNPKNGYVEITFACSDTNLTIYVKDNGIGIPQKQMGSLFNKFFRAENAVRTVPNGSGLGLYITKSIMESHNGFVGVESTEGKGSTFSLTLPLSGVVETPTAGT